MIVDIQTRVRKLKRDLQLSRKPDYREQLREQPPGVAGHRSFRKCTQHCSSCWWAEAS